MADKRLNAKYKWNPYLLWRILRTVPEYQNAVNDFISHARANNDLASLNLYERLKSNDRIEEFSEDGTLGEIGETSPEEYLDTLEVYTGATSDEVEDIIYGSGEGCFGVDPSTSHFQIFLDLYGDVLRFPIPFDVKNPAPDLLNSLWTLKPATLLGPINVKTSERERSRFLASDLVQDGKYTFDGDDSSLERVEILNLQVNWNFSEEEIIESFARTLREHSNFASEIKFKRRVRGENKIEIGLKGFKPTWKTLLKYLDVWDLHVARVAHKEKGRRIYPGNSLKVQGRLQKKSKDEAIDVFVEDRTYIELARTAIRYVESIRPFLVRSKHLDSVKKVVGD